MMTALEPGIRVGFAPHFQNTRLLPERLQVNSGVVEDAGRFWPRPDWRAPTDAELALLTARDGGDPDAVQLFHIPERLRSRWWEFAAGQASPEAKPVLSFTQVAGEFNEFLEFKRLPVPRPAALEVAVSGPGLASVKPDQAGLAAVWPGARLCGGINLSDEESSLVLINLGESQLAEGGEAADFADRLRGFLRGNLDYPVVRIRLQPCEGYWLPAVRVAMDFDTRGRIEVDVQLVIREAESKDI